MMNKNGRRGERAFFEAASLTTIFVLVVMSMFITLQLTPVYADSTETVYVEGTYGQSEAREMLDMINEFRTNAGTEGDAQAWWLDPDGSGERIEVTGLQPLVYDYALEERAMQRAAELAVKYSHTRPDGTSSIDLAAGVNAENIAYGYASAEEVFNAWLEANETSFEKQGHRSNMLGGYYVNPNTGELYTNFLNTIGIAHFVYDGVDFWVQEFGESPTGAAHTDATDSSETVSVSVDSSLITGYDLETSGDINLSYLDTLNLSEIGVTSTASITNGNLGPHSYPIDAQYIWENLDDSVLSLEGNVVTAIKVGEGKLSVSDSHSNPEILNITVGKKDISSAVVTPEVCPKTFKFGDDPTYSEVAPVLTINGNELVLGTDYIVGYLYNNTYDNIWNQEQTFFVRRGPEIKLDFFGKGNYDGTIVDGYSVYSEPYDELSISTSADTEIELTMGETATAEIEPNWRKADFSNFVVNIENEDIVSAEVKKSSTNWSDNVKYNAVFTPKKAGTTTVEVKIPENANAYNESNSLVFTVTVNPADMTGKAVVGGIEETYKWTGDPVTPVPTVMVGNDKLTAGEDFTVSYLIDDEVVENPTGSQFDAVEVTLLVTGTGNRYTGTATTTYTINPVSFTIENIEAQYEYRPGGVKPVPVVSLDGTVLKQGTDYTVEYGSNDTVGEKTGSVVVTGKGAYYYSGKQTKYFDITKANMEDVIVTPEVCPKTFNNGDDTTYSEVAPVLTIDGTELVLGTDYIVGYLYNNTYGNIWNPEESFYIRRPEIELDFFGQGGFEGTLVGAYTVYSEPYDELSISTSADPDIKLLLDDTASAEIEPSWRKVYFNNFEVNIDNEDIVSAEVKRDGSGVDKVKYNLVFTPKKAGTTTVEVKIPQSENSYNESNTLVFNVTVEKNSFDEAVTAELKDPSAVYRYTSPTTKFTPEFEVYLGSRKLVKQTEYTYEYQDNTYAGTGKIIITPAGALADSYSGSNILTFEILTRDTVFSLSEEAVTIDFGEEKAIAFEGAASANPINVTLSGNQDAVKVRVDKNDASGKIYIKGTAPGTVVIDLSQDADNMFSGVSGQIRATVNTWDVPAEKVTVSVLGDDQVYDGTQKTPEVSVSIDGEVIQPSLYDVSYGENVGPGTGTVTVSGKNGLSFTASAEFTINEPPVSITEAEVKLGKTSMTYTGKALKPSVTVTYEGETLTKGTDYTVTYSNNTNAGKAKVTISGTGRFSDSVTKSFTITKAANTMTLKGKTVTVKYSAVKKKTQTVKLSKAITVSKPCGSRTFTKTKGSSKITINKKTGNITVKKGIKKGTYKVTVKVKAAGDSNHKDLSKTVTFTIKVR